MGNIRSLMKYTTNIRVHVQYCKDLFLMNNDEFVLEYTVFTYFRTFLDQIRIPYRITIQNAKSFVIYY